MDGFSNSPFFFERGSLFEEDMRREFERLRMTGPRFPFQSYSPSPPSSRYTYTQEREKRYPYTAESHASTSSSCGPECYPEQSRTRTRRTYQTEGRVSSDDYECEYVEFTQKPWGASYAYFYNEFSANPPTPPHSPYTRTYTSSGRSRGAPYTTEERRLHSISPKPRQQRKGSSSYQYSRLPPSESYSSYRESHSALESIKPHTDLYTVLKISSSATTDDIKRAYRALSLKWHPDRCKSEDRAKATRKMAEINQAKEVLCDEEKRDYYDRFGLVSSDL